jgi:hypothetical protein
MSKKPLVLSALALVLAAPASAAGDPVAAVKVDATQLLADSKSAHDGLIADLQRLTSDAQAAKGGSKEAARAAIKADLAKLRSDRQTLLAPVKADRAQLKADLKAAREAKAGKGELKPVLQQLRSTLKQQRAETRAALRTARQAVRELRASFKS